jgi:hypothetical protein
MRDHPDSVLSLDTGSRSGGALDQLCINAVREHAMGAMLKKRCYSTMALPLNMSSHVHWPY